MNERPTAGHLDDHQTASPAQERCHELADPLDRLLGPPPGPGRDPAGRRARPSGRQRPATAISLCRVA